MPPLPFNYVVRLLRASASGDVGPTPALNIDLTSTLDSRITFTRAGSRNYINAGVLTALASSNVPAFESWDGVSRGMAIEPAFTNLLTFSTNPSDTSWLVSGGAITTGDVPSGSVLTQLYRFDSTATNDNHRVRRDVGISATAGDVQTVTAYVKAASGSTAYSFYIHFANKFNNAGTNYAFRIDGKEGFFASTDANLGNVTYGYRKLDGGIYQVWITGTWAATGNKEIWAGLSSDTATDTRAFTALATDSFQIGALQLATASGPTGLVITGAATASQAGESAVFNDASWLTTAQGTFVVEHDCWNGPVIGSGANTVLGATVRGKTAIAWSGSTSDTVNNGGASTTGVQPTFSGSDIRLLATTGATNTGHIKSIKFYNTRLTVEEMQVLTAPNVVVTAQPGILRTVSVNNRLPSGLNTTSGSALTFTSRFKMTIGGSDCSELRLDFPNINWAGKTTVGNAVNIESVALERETGVVEFAPVYVGGSRSFSLANDAATTVVSDSILPAAFTGLTKFDAGMTFWVRVKGSVTTAGHNVPGSRFGAETGAFAKLYNPATVTYSDVDATGAITLVSGSNVGSLTIGYCPILVGKFVSGDPKTIFVIGDSIIEGTNGLDATGTFIRLGAQALGVPQLEMSRGGESQLTAAANSATWTPYLKYARVLIDEMGTNNANALLDFFVYWNAAKVTYTYDKIIRVGLFPRASSSDSWTTEANQTVARIYPAEFPDLHSIDLLKYGNIDYNLDPQSVRGTNKAKWLTNGTAFYTTVDGTHQSASGNALLATEFQAFLDTVTVT